MWFLSALPKDRCQVLSIPRPHHPSECLRTTVVLEGLGFSWGCGKGVANKRWDQ